MANKQNLKSLADRTPEERKRIASAGGRKSRETYKARKTMREMLRELLDARETNDQYISMMRKRGFNKSEITNQAVILMAQMEKAKKGDVRSAVFLRDSVGEKPADKHEVTGADGAPFMNAPMTQSEARALIEKLENDV